MSSRTRSPLLTKEDYWAIWLGLGLILVAFLFYVAGGTLKDYFAVGPPKAFASFSELGDHLAAKWHWYLALYGVFLAIFMVSMRIMGHSLKEYVPGFTILYVASLAILALTNHQWAREHELNYALVALAIGLVIGNLIKLPPWVTTSLRTEYYIKTGIVMLGATLPLTLIVRAGPIAFVQATIVSVVTFSTIYGIGTYIFKLDKRFSSTMGAGGAVCGVSASLAVGGAVKADKEHIAISISIVTIAALIMIFVLPILSKVLGLHPGVAGAWIGNSEFADAAGFAAAEAIRAPGDEAVKAFTLIKVIGRDIWIGIWAFVLSLVSVVYWERQKGGEKPGAGVIWERFPKFVIGFFLASIFISIVSFATPEELFDTKVKADLISPIKTLRTWTFCFTFLCIGLTTRFKELTRFGVKPLYAFGIGVLVNVPLGLFLSQVVFGKYWRGL
jgi:uncharacterized integral membrane protein (TIGR00698 family)